jgi:flagellar biosynthesis protein
MNVDSRKAVALKYNSSVDVAPKVVAKGRGYIAEKIIAIAREAGVPLYSDPDLIEVLSAVELGDEIPASLYQAVAEILAFIYTLNNK